MSHLILHAEDPNDHSKVKDMDAFSLGDVSTDPRYAGLTPLLTADGVVWARPGKERGQFEDANALADAKAAPQEPAPGVG